MSKPPREQISPETRRDIRRAFFTLLAVGLVIGALTATGLVKLMDHFNLFGVPEQRQ